MFPIFVKNRDKWNIYVEAIPCRTGSNMNNKAAMKTQKRSDDE